MALSKEDDTLILGGAVIALAYFGVLKPITDALGLTDDAATKKKKQQNDAANASDGWDPNFYKEQTKKLAKWTILTSAAATKLAQQIGNAWGYINDDEEAIYAVFRSLKSQLQLSQLCDYYNQLYKHDLLTRLHAPWFSIDNDGLTEDQFANVAAIVNKLPVNYIAA